MGVSQVVHRLKAVAENQFSILKLRVEEGRKQLFRALFCAVGAGLFATLACLALGGALVATLWAFSPTVAFLAAAGSYSLVAIVLCWSLKNTFGQPGEPGDSAEGVTGSEQKDILDAETRLNLLRLKAELEAVTAELQSLAAPRSSLETIITSTASLVESIAAFRRTPAGPGTKRRSLPIILNAAALVSGLWIASRTTETPRNPVRPD